MSAKPRLEGSSLVLDFTVSAGLEGQEPSTSAFSISLPVGEEGAKGGEATAGIVKLGATLERSANYWSLDWRLERTDLHEGMWKD